MTVEKIAELADRLAQERSFARTIVPLIADADWSSPIPQEWRTVGFVQELLDLAYDLSDKDPSRSVRLAQFALTIVTTIPRDTYPETMERQVEGNVWLQMARSHRTQSQWHQALRALDRAEARFGSSAALGHDLAVAVLQRALIFGEMRRFDDALRLLREITPALEEFGDLRRVRHARLIEAMAYHRLMQFDRARAIYEDLVKTLDDDPQTLAVLLNTIADLRTRTGDIDGALSAAQKSVGLARELGMTTEVVRAEWTLARLQMQVGQWAQAAALLQEVRSEFLRLELPEEAGLAGLDLVEWLVASDQPASAVELTNEVIAEFNRARLNERATTALMYLRELLPDKARAVRAVQHVRSYIARLKDEPALLFLALPQ